MLIVIVIIIIITITINVFALVKIYPVFNRNYRCPLSVVR